MLAFKTIEIAVFLAITNGVSQWELAVCAGVKTGAIIIEDFISNTRIVAKVSVVFIAVIMRQIATVHTGSIEVKRGIKIPFVISIAGKVTEIVLASLDFNKRCVTIIHTLSVPKGEISA